MQERKYQLKWRKHIECQSIEEAASIIKRWAGPYKYDSLPIDESMVLFEKESKWPGDKDYMIIDIHPSKYNN